MAGLGEQLIAADRPHAFRDSGLGQRLRDTDDEWVSVCGICGEDEDRPIHGPVTVDPRAELPDECEDPA